LAFIPVVEFGKMLHSRSALMRTEAKTAMGTPDRSATGNIPALERFAQCPALLPDKIHLFVAELKA
jgi:hypothetical protein